MSQLTKEQRQSAISFNRRQHYPKEIWAQVQKRVGAASDGVPGGGTADGVAQFQTEIGAQVDGKVGEQTLAAMDITLPAFDRIHRLDGDSAFFYLGKMAVDADGAPDAYHPDDAGLDALGNAGKPGSWWGLACDDAGTPYIQSSDDPCPGYYVSTTALCDRRYPRHDPRRYVDATRIPYIVLPGNLKSLIDVEGLHKGDLAAVCRVEDPTTVVFAIYADVGPKWRPGHEPGEGSIALARALGHEPCIDGRVKRGVASGVFYVVFPGSGKRTPLSNDQILARGQKAFDAWGGAATLARAIATATR